VYAILNDIHFPFEDRQRYALALNILKSIKPDHIYLNGDIGEFQGVSSWPIHPTEKKMGFVEELQYINKRLDELQAMFPDVPVTLIEGNHCNRFFRYIRDVAPAMWGVIDCPALLKFPDRPGWKFVVYGPKQLVRAGDSNLYLRHEPLGRGANHAKATAENSVVDIAYGHTHTFQVHTHRKFGPTPVMTKAYSLGWLGDKSRHVFDYRGPKDSWCTGITQVECDIKSGRYSLDFISLELLPIFFKGKTYTFKDEKTEV
jgi:Calcineurin-like phosphoesterase